MESLESMESMESMESAEGRVRKKQRTEEPIQYVFMVIKISWGTFSCDNSKKIMTKDVVKAYAKAENAMRELKRLKDEAKEKFSSADKNAWTFGMIRTEHMDYKVEVMALIDE